MKTTKDKQIESKSQDVPDIRDPKIYEALMEIQDTLAEIYEQITALKQEVVEE